jgi:hypothetical protein
VRDRPDPGTQARDLARREGPADEAAEPRVLRRVVGVHQVLPPVEEGAAIDALVREHLVERLAQAQVAQQRVDVRVAQHLEVSRRGAHHGPALAQRRQRAVRVLPVGGGGRIDEPDPVPGQRAARAGAAQPAHVIACSSP